MYDELKRAYERSKELEFKVQEMTILLKSKEELLLKGGITTADQVRSDQMLEGQIKEMRLLRQLDTLKEQQQYLSNMHEKDDKTIKQLEAQLLQHEGESKQLIQTLHEQIQALQLGQLECDKDSDIRLLLDTQASLHTDLNTSLPVAQRLQEALSRLEAVMHTIGEQDTQLAKQHAVLEDLKQQLAHKEEQLLKKELQIQEIAVNMHGAASIVRSSESSDGTPTVEQAVDYRTLQNLYHNALDEIERLEQMLSKKEESALRLKEMFQQSKRTYEVELSQAKQQLDQLSDQIHQTNQLTVEQFKAQWTVKDRPMSDDSSAGLFVRAYVMCFHNVKISMQEMDHMLVQKETIIRNLNIQLAST